MASHSPLIAAVLMCALGPALSATAASASSAAQQGSRSSAAVAPSSVPRDSNPSSAIATVRTNSGERVEFAAAEDKRTLVGSYWAPKTSGSVIAPGVVLVHRPGGQRNDLAEVAARLHKQGFAVLAIDLRGHGESIGKDKSWAELGEEERARVWAFALRDVRGGAAWLAKQTGVHSSNVCLVGDRAGCTLVVRHATRDETVRAVVLLDPPREQLGFQLAKDIEALAGLPTLFFATKESAGAAQAIAAEGEKANDGMKYIELAVFKGVSVSVPNEFDKADLAQIAKFLSDRAMAKKAR